MELPLRGQEQGVPELWMAQCPSHRKDPRGTQHHFTRSRTQAAEDLSRSHLGRTKPWGQGRCRLVSLLARQGLRVRQGRCGSHTGLGEPAFLSPKPGFVC